MDWFRGLVPILVAWVSSIFNNYRSKDRLPMIQESYWRRGAHPAIWLHHHRDIFRGEDRATRRLIIQHARATSRHPRPFRELSPLGFTVPDSKNGSKPGMTNNLAQSTRSSSREVLVKVNSAFALLCACPLDCVESRQHDSGLAPSPFRPLVAPNSCLEATITQLECVLLHPHANQIGTATRLSTNTHISAPCSVSSVAQ